MERRQIQCNESNLHRYRSVEYKLIRQNIDIGTLNRDEIFWRRSLAQFQLQFHCHWGGSSMLA